MLFGYVSGQQWIINNKKTTKNAGKLLAISIAMRMQRYNAGPIAQ